MSSSQQPNNVRPIPDIPFFIRNTYSHTIHLQKSLFGEVILGTLKVANNPIVFKPHDNARNNSQAVSINVVGGGSVAGSKPTSNVNELSSTNTLSIIGSSSTNTKTTTAGANGASGPNGASAGAGAGANGADGSTSVTGTTNNLTTTTTATAATANAAATSHGRSQLSYEKHVIKMWDKMLWQQVNAESPLIEIDVMQRFCSESACHPYFVKFIDSFEDHSSYCARLEYIPTGDLCNYIQLNGPFDFERARRYAKQITIAVEHLHKNGYCHLDLSLENILLDQATDTIRLCDFGLCRKMLPNKKPFDSTAIQSGKKSYIAPEIYNHAPFYGDKADIFSLGVIYFILFCGFPPFDKPCLTEPRFRHIYEKDINVLLEKWQLTHIIPPQCADILNKIFVGEAKRISMQELLGHPFWIGVQLNEIEVLHVASSKVDKQEEIGRNPMTVIHEALPCESICEGGKCNSADDNSIDDDSLKPTVSNSTTSVTTCQDQAEIKFENEETSDEAAGCVDFHYCRRGDVLPEHNVSCEIHKRVTHGNEDVVDSAVESIIDGIWNFEIPTDEE